MIGILFSTVSVVLIFAYLPQIITLIRTKGPCNDISVTSWSIWFYTSFVSLLYSIYELHDLKLSIVNGLNVFFICVIIGTTIFKRIKYRHVAVIYKKDESVDNLSILPDLEISHSDEKPV